MVGKASSKSVPTLSIGDKLGRYEILANLGCGGMATVHLARIVGPGACRKLVALKTILPHLAERRDVVEMFIDEATISAYISHPNVCSVVDFGQIGEVWYLAMEYLEGVSLSSMLKASRRYLKTSPKERSEFISVYCRMIVNACKGLHAAHEAVDDRGKPLNIVHRDISPDNIFITHDGTVKVVDFGIAAAQGRLHHTTTGVMKGKMRFLSPEALNEELVDRRADIWAMGVVLWEGLCLRNLFKRTTSSQTIAAVLTYAIPKPSGISSAIPAILDHVVEGALTRPPKKRFQTALELSQSLEKASRVAKIFAKEAEIISWIDLILPGHRQVLRAELSRALEETDPREVDLPIEPVSVSATFERAGSDQGPITSPTPSQILSTPNALFGASSDAGIVSSPEDALSDEETPFPPIRRKSKWFWLFITVFLLGGLTYLYVAGQTQVDGDSNRLSTALWQSLAGPGSNAGQGADAGAQEASATGISTTLIQEAGHSSDADVEQLDRVPDGDDATIDQLDADIGRFDGNGERVDALIDRSDAPIEHGGVNSNHRSGKSRPRPSRPRPQRPRKNDGESTPPVISAPMRNRYGKVRVVTPGGWAEVYHRGRRMSSLTPSTVSIPEGRQILELRFNGRSPGVRIAVMVVADRTVSVIRAVP